MKYLLIAPLMITFSLLPPLCAQADTASEVAWTPKQLKFVKNGHAEKGKVLAETCASCHSEQGRGIPAAENDDVVIPATPALAGQNANYTYKQLRDYAQDYRNNDSMNAIAKGLSEQDTADLAVWFSTLPLPKIYNNSKKLLNAASLVAEGDGKRLLPPCFVCHGAQGQGEKMDLPALAGQQADYFAKTLLAYKNGERHNDVYSRMRLIAQQLTEEEIKALSVYYQSAE